MKEEKTAKSLLFYYHDGDEDEEDIGPSLRSFCNLSAKSRVALVDIPNQSVSFHTVEPRWEVDVQNFSCPLCRGCPYLGGSIVSEILPPYRSMTSPVRKL